MVELPPEESNSTCFEENQKMWKNKIMLLKNDLIDRDNNLVCYKGAHKDYLGAK